MPLEDYLRSFELLRPSLEGLPPEEPEFVRPLAAVTLHARLQRRDFRDETLELSETTAKAMPRDMPPPPEEFTDVSRTLLAEIVRRQRCTVCGVNPGMTACAECHGSYEGCADCQKGWVTCTTCDGAKVVVIATIRHVEDREVVIRHTYLPATSLLMEDVLLGRFLEDEPDDCLRFDVDLRSTNAPYREAEGDHTSGGLFHDHAFMGAIDRARAAVAAIAGREWIREEVSAYARPFLWVGWPSENVAIVADPRAIHLIRA